MDAPGTRQMGGKDPRKVFPLSRLAASISVQLERTFHTTYWITAEINKLNFYPQSGHCFPELVEKENGSIVAQLKAFILNSRYSQLDTQFKAATGKALGDGMQVLMRCKVSFHAVYGLSLNIIDIDPSYTTGEMARMRLEAIQKLKEEGIFTKNKSVHRPLLLKRLAVISVETSKGWQDFRNTLDHSAHGAVIQTTLYPALLQGDAAVKSLQLALRRVAEAPEPYEAVCIIRGGGGETGFDCYDHYELAAAVCHFPIPVLTGIGHAANLTLTELCAHKNLITPTALAAYILTDFDQFSQRIEVACRALFNAKRGLIREQVLKLQANTLALAQASESFQEQQKMELHNSARSFDAAVSGRLASHEALVKYLMPARIAEIARKTIRNREQKMHTAIAALRHESMARVQHEDGRIQLHAEKARLLDPTEVLRRGYSITLHEGQAVTDASTLQAGETIETRFASGKSHSTISRTEP